MQKKVNPFAERHYTFRSAGGGVGVGVGVGVKVVETLFAGIFYLSTSYSRENAAHDSCLPEITFHFQFRCAGHYVFARFQ